MKGSYNWFNNRYILHATTSHENDIENDIINDIENDIENDNETRFETERDEALDEKSKVVSCKICLINIQKLHLQVVNIVLVLVPLIH